MTGFEDRLEIRELIERFHDAINHRNFAAIGELFTDDGVWEIVTPLPLRFQGRANVVSGIAENVGQLEFLFQACSPIVIELKDETHAIARTSIQEFGRVKDGPSMRIVATYFDRFQKVEGVWRISERVFRARYVDQPELSGQILEDVQR